MSSCDFGSSRVSVLGGHGLLFIHAGHGMSPGVVCALAISGSCSHGKERKEESPGSRGQDSRLLREAH